MKYLYKNVQKCKSTTFLKAKEYEHVATSPQVQSTHRKDQTN